MCVEIFVFRGFTFMVCKVDKSCVAMLVFNKKKEFIHYSISCIWIHFFNCLNSQHKSLVMTSRRHFFNQFKFGR